MTRTIHCLTVLAGLSLPATAHAQSWKVPTHSRALSVEVGRRRHARIGESHEARVGAQGRRLIKTGEVIEIGQVLNAAMPFFGTRRFDVHTKRTFMNNGSNHRGSNEELVVGEMGQVGTQFDGFAHQTHEDSLYNCLKLDDIATRSGFTKLGIEKVGSLITRGVLIDVAALKGVEMLPDTYEITPPISQQALERQKLTLQPGDAVLIHTGWGRLWAKDNARYVKSYPGIGIARGGVAGETGSDAGRRRQLAGRSRAQSRSAAVTARAPVHARRERHPPAREPEARRARVEARARVRLRRPAAQDAGLHGVDGGADCDSVKALHARGAWGSRSVDKCGQILLKHKS